MYASFFQRGKEIFSYIPFRFDSWKFETLLRLPGLAFSIFPFGGFLVNYPFALVPTPNMSRKHTQEGNF